jgi:hypothetical protein
LSGDANAAIPGPPTNGGPCVPGIGYDLTTNCFRYAFSPGSSVDLDIVGSAVTFAGGTLIVDAVTPVATYAITLTTGGLTLSLAAGATGTLTGDNILWAAPVNLNMTAGTINCAGANCSLFSHPGVPIPFEPWYGLVTNTTGVTALNLGQWNLDPLHTSIIASSNAIARWANLEDLPDRRYNALTFAATSLGNPVPEPSSIALVLLGLGALALRSRKA